MRASGILLAVSMAALADSSPDGAFPPFAETGSDPYQRVDGWLRWELSQSLMEQGWYEQAAFELGKVRRIYPGQTRIEFLLGAAHMLQGDLEAAEASLRTALELDPGTSEALAMLGNLRLQKGRWREGCILLERALQQEPEWSALRLVLVETYLERGHARKAGPHLKLLDAADRNGGMGQYLYARYWQAMGEPVQAWRHAAAAAARSPEKPAFQREYGLALYRVNRPEEAIPYLLRALGAGQRDETLLSALGESLFRQRRWEEAQKTWEAGLRLHGSSPEMRIRLLDFYLQSGQRIRAEELIAKPIGGALESLLRCRFDRKMGSFAAAARGLERSRRQAPSALLPHVLWEEASLLLEQGKFRDFEKSAQRLLRSGYRAEEVFLLRARAALARSDAPAARDLLERARKANPFSHRGGILAQALEAEYPAALAKR